MSKKRNTTLKSGKKSLPKKGDDSFVKSLLKSNDTNNTADDIDDIEGGAKGGGASTKSTLKIIGVHDTQREDLSKIFDKEGAKILTKYASEEMGNKARQARKGKKIVKYGSFGKKSTEEFIQKHLWEDKNSEKAPQNVLGNVHVFNPKPRGPS